MARLTENGIKIERACSRVMAIAVAALAGFVLLGWTLGSRAMIGIFPGSFPMHPLTAILLAMGALSLWLYGGKRSSLKRIAGFCCAGSVALAGAARLVGYWVGAGQSAEQFLFPATFKEISIALAPVDLHVAPNTSLDFVLIGGALLIIYSRQNRLRLLALILTLSSILIAVLTISGHFINVAGLGSMVSYVPMAVGTATAFLLLATGVIFELADLKWQVGNGCGARLNEQSLARQSLENKIAIGFGAALLTICVIGIVSYQCISQFIVDSHWDNHTYQVLASIHSIYEDLSDSAGAGRGYVITGDEHFLEPWRAAMDRIDPSVDSVQRLTADNPSQQQRIEVLRPLLRQKLEFFKMLVDVRRRWGFDAARLLLLMPQGTRLMDKIRGVLIEMEAEENFLLRKRVPETESNARRSIALVTGGAAFSVILVSLAGWTIYRGVVVRMRAQDELLARTSQLEAVDGELRETLERFKSLIESAKEYAIFMLDPDGLIKSWNSGAQRLKGYLADEIIGQHFSRFYSPQDVQNGKPERELKIAIETGHYEEDGWRFRQDGSRFWANVLITAIYDSRGTHIGFSKITRDLTERVRAEEQTRNFFALSLELLCIASVDGYFKLLNPAWENALGFTQAELCSRPFMDFIHPDDRPATVAAAKRITTAEPLSQFENRYCCKDGSYRLLQWKVALSADLQLMYAAASDITEQKRTEDEIAALNKTLQRQNLELESTNKELEAFSYSVSHDLRAPLRSLDGFSQALLEDCSENLDAHGKDYLRRVRAGSQRMGQLIDDLLNLSRVTRVEMTRELVDLSKIVHEVAEELRATAPERDAEFVVTEGLLAETDPRLIRIVLTNLLGNAWKFTAKQPRARIEFGCSADNGCKAYFMRDNGAGFDEAYASKLFGAFQRLHSATDFPGTGIGLATVQRIVLRQGGRVWAEGKVKEGAIFHFTL
jgi:PAS domain S-box-containing protein